MTQRQGLPSPRGPVSDSLVRRLRTTRGSVARPAAGGVLADEDLQLSLHVIHELSYRGYDGVPEWMEWDTDVVRVRRRVEAAMESDLRDLLGVLPADAPSLLERLASGTRARGSEADERSLSSFLEQHPHRSLLREFAVHRSAYQLKEADPHSWALPRLDGRAKSALVELQADEYGRGVPGEAHAELWAVTMAELGLDPRYGHYVDHLPATTLATGNLIGVFGLQRRLLPALIGHLALFEMTSTGPMSRYSAAFRAAGIGGAGRRFFDVHVVADAHHERVALHDLVGAYLDDQPSAGREVSFGALALVHVEGAFSAALLDAFERGESSLLTPLDEEFAPVA
jgi:hypothetical protein